MLLVRAIFRQLKTRCLLVFGLLKRLFCCFARRRSKDDEENSPEEEECGFISNGDFVVVDTQDKPQAYNYSSYSLATMMQQQASSNISPYTSPAAKVAHRTKQVAEPKHEPEPDYFQDMVPKVKKPKTIYIGKSESEESASEMARKFRVDDRAAVELDESKFQPFGTFDLSHSQQQQQHQHHLQQLQDENEGWEAMADEEGAWQEMEQTLQEHRRAEREKRLREHQLQREAKLARKTVLQQQQQQKQY